MDLEIIPTCDFCQPGYEHKFYVKAKCKICKGVFDICANHDVTKVYQCTICRHFFCPDCMGWDRQKQQYTMNCPKCDYNHAPPIPESDFDKIQEDQETKRGYKRIKPNPSPKAPVELVIGLNTPSTTNNAAVYTSKELRILSWNVRDLGGGPSDIPAVRDDAAIATIAGVIFLADPHICAIIEVKAGANKRVRPKPKSKKVEMSSYHGKKRRKAKGTQTASPTGAKGMEEVERIMKALNGFDTGKQWKYATHKDKEVFPDGETYVFIYKDTPDIELVPDSNIYVTKDSNGKDLDFPTKQDRRPMQAIFEFKGTLASKGKPWQLPVVAFHAPAPNHGQATVDAVESLTKMGVYIGTAKQDISELVICADLNIDSNYPLNYTKDGNELTNAEFAEKGMKILDAASLTHWVNTETSHNTTLKEVTTHYLPDEYEDEYHLVQDDYLVWLFETGITSTEFVTRKAAFLHHYQIPIKDESETKDIKYADLACLFASGIDLTEFATRKTKFLKDCKLPTRDANELKKAEEFLQKCKNYYEGAEAFLQECKDYYEQEKDWLTSTKVGMPDSTFDFTNASYDKILLHSKIDSTTKDIDGICVLRSGGEVCVFPMLSLLAPPSVLEPYFNTQDAYSVVDKFGFEGDLKDTVKGLFPYYYKKLCARFDDAVAEVNKKKQEEILKILFKDETVIDQYLNKTDWQAYFAKGEGLYNAAFSGGITEKEMTLNACLLIAGQISDHLPLFMSAEFD